MWSGPLLHVFWSLFVHFMNMAFLGAEVWTAIYSSYHFKFVLFGESTDFTAVSLLALEFRHGQVVIQCRVSASRNYFIHILTDIESSNPG